jgi:hypothetical protein
MTTLPTFVNFDIQIAAEAGERASIAVSASPAGETSSPTLVALPRHDPALATLLERLREGFAGRDDLHAVGRRLAALMLPPGPVRTLFQRSRGMAEANKQRLRLRLRVTTPELAALPWEYALDEDSDDFFALNPTMALVRYHSQPTAAVPITSHAPVPVLVLVAGPADQPPLRASRELRSLIEALGRLLDVGQVRVDILFGGNDADRAALEAQLAGRRGARLLPAPATIDTLRDALRQEYRVVHYIGHGAFDVCQGGALLLCDEDGLATRVGGQALARELRGSGVAVVVLNACQSAAEDTGPSFMGLAPALVQAGTPAVVAMQFAIEDASARSFSQALYRALADGWPLDAAVTEGRKAISARLGPDDHDWGVPVLFMRAPDGIIWRQGAPESNRPGGHPGEGIAALVELMQAPQVRIAAVAFSTELQAASAQIRTLGQHKKLHDLFQELETRYQVIEQERRHLHEDESFWESLILHEPEVQGAIDELLGFAAAITTGAELLWTQQLSHIQSELRAAVDESDVERLASAARRLGRVLDREPSRINTRLVAAADALRLDHLNGTMATIRATLAGGSRELAAARQFEAGLLALARMSDELVPLVRSHKAWQDIDDELRRIEANLSDDFDELRAAWPDIARMARPLFGGSEAAWAQALVRVGGDLDAAIQAQSTTKIRRLFHQYRSQAGRRFRQVDDELLKICGDLQSVGTTLELLLKAIA